MMYDVQQISVTGLMALPSVAQLNHVYNRIFITLSTDSQHRRGRYVHKVYLY